VPPIGQLLLVSLTMVFGSFVAGFTALGGGAVAFPVLTKLLGYSVYDARQFGVMIQSVGMTSASVYLLRVQGRSLIDRTFLIYLGGSFAGAVFSFLALSLGAETIKLMFSIFIFTFAAGNLFNLSLRLKVQDVVVMACGFLGGILSQNIGTGADGLFYMMSVLLFGWDTHRAVWQSVIVMAGTSIFITVLNILFAEISSLVFWSWVFAAPVVVVGATFGAFMSRRVEAHVLKFALFFLASVELTWTLTHRAGLI